MKVQVGLGEEEGGAMDLHLVQECSLMSRVS